MNMKKRKLKTRFRKLLNKSVPLWLLLAILLNSSMILVVGQYYIMKRNFDSQILELSKSTKSPEELVQILKQQVLPQGGFTLAVEWNDIGKKLLESGVIDQTKYEELFANDEISKKYMWHLNNTSKDRMMVNEQNSHFMVNTLWALGLVNKSKVLDEGPMRTQGDGNFMNYASTGGWTLGSRPTEELYSSQKLIDLTPKQEELAKRIAENVFRPCCGNHSAFPDCNHGMAVLGYVELAVKQRVSEERIYKDLLALNSFWFPQNYIEIAAYFQKQGTKWNNIDAKLALSSRFSSAQGSQQVREEIQNVPGLNVSGGGCGA